VIFYYIDDLVRHDCELNKMLNKSFGINLLLIKLAIL
jgi:hypothetical protein